MLNQLTVGKTAVFNHGDMGLIDVYIEGKAPIKDYYTGVIKKVHLKKVRVKQSALITSNLVSEGNKVSVFVQPKHFVKYKD